MVPWVSETVPWNAREGFLPGTTLFQRIPDLRSYEDMTPIMSPSGVAIFPTMHYANSSFVPAVVTRCINNAIDDCSRRCAYIPPVE